MRIQVMKEWAPLEVEYYKRAYVAASKGNYDIYAVFVERGLNLLSGRGRLGFILPHKFFNAKYGEPLRELLSRGRHLAEVVHFGDLQVFRGATTYTCLMFLNKAGTDECRVMRVADLDAWRTGRDGTEGVVPAASITAAEWNLNVGTGSDLFERLNQMTVKLGHVAHTFVGTQTSADTVFVLDDCRTDGDQVTGWSKSLGTQVRVELACTQPYLRGKQIRRYEPPETNARLICPYDISVDKCRLLGLTEMHTQ